MSSKISIKGKNVISLIKYDDAFSAYIPNLIKMDIEGAEYNALLGMKKQFLNISLIYVYLFIINQMI